MPPTSSEETVRLGIQGAAGRMGRRLVALATEDPGLSVVCALEHGEHPELGHDAGEVAGIGRIGVPLVTELSTPVQVLIDFSAPHATTEVLANCVARSVPLVLATTGLSGKQRQLAQQAANSIPLVWSPNMSLAVNLTMRLAQIVAEKLKHYGPGVDVEIIERHHRYKEDAPSGTAVRFGELIAEKMGQTRHLHGRSGRPGQRSRDEIGYHALRAGDNPGEHTIVFGLLGETVELSVKAVQSRLLRAGRTGGRQVHRQQAAGPVLDA